MLKKAMGSRKLSASEGAVAAQCGNSGTNDGKDQSRSSLPVRCRKTDSKIGSAQRNIRQLKAVLFGVLEQARDFSGVLQW